MKYLIEDVTAGGIFFLTIFIGFYLLLIIIEKLAGKKVLPKFHLFLERNSLLFALIIASIAMIGSLWFSEILGYPPCKLCWYQRITIFPLVPILAVAYFKKRTDVKGYTLPLIFIGGAIAVYQVLSEYSIINEVCGVSLDAAASCSTIIIQKFGFITIPWMSFITLFSLAILLIQAKNNKNV